MAFEQALRQASVSTVLGTDTVVLERLNSSERLSELFSIIVDVIAPDGAIDFTPLLGTAVTVAMQASDVPGGSRNFNGRLFEAQFTAATDMGVHYRLTLRPSFALLQGNLGMRIFQSISVPDILKKLINERGLGSDYKFDATGTYPPRTYCVQYRESDFNFLSRLMEEEGLYYYFEHLDGREVMHVCDQTMQHPMCDGLAEVPYIASEGGDRYDRPPHLWRWDEHVRSGAAKVALRDYSFLQPGKQFEGADNASGGGGPAEQSEIYDYPGGYNAYDVSQMDAQKDRYASLRLAASRAERQKCLGQGDAFAIACGTRFAMTDYVIDRLNDEYLAIATSHVMDAEAYRSGSGSNGLRYQVDVEAIPSDTQWRPVLKTPKPLAGGPQTATVVGRSGEVIDPDEHGRVKVQFHWDREGQNNEKSSCWIRVSQAWADGGFGTMLIPRVGEEVIVDFVDGDPDQPIITGRVYNPGRNVPYGLPANKTRSTWKSRTVGKSGDYSGAEDPPPLEGGMNEIRFEDIGGSEEFYEHAQRDKNVWIRLDESRKTGRDVTVRVGRNRRTNVKANETLTVETGDETRTLEKGSRTTKIKKSDELTIQTGDSTTTVETGNSILTVSKGKVLIEAMQEIQLKVGNNTLKLSPSGLEVKALSVKIDADTSLSASGLTSELKASTLLTINGSLVKINLTGMAMEWTRVKWSEAGQITAFLGDRAISDGQGVEPEGYFAMLVAAGRLDDAVKFLALALPRFETVAWAARAVRDISDPDSCEPLEAAALKSALLWLQDPGETRRRTAFDSARAARPNSAECMAAMAVFYSGGSVAPPDCEPLPAPREAAGRFAAGAILLAAARQPDMGAALRRALALGETFAVGTEAR